MSVLVGFHDAAEVRCRVRGGVDGERHSLTLTAAGVDVVVFGTADELRAFVGGLAELLDQDLLPCEGEAGSPNRHGAVGAAGGELTIERVGPSAATPSQVAVDGSPAAAGCRAAVGDAPPHGVPAAAHPTAGGVS